MRLSLKITLLMLLVGLIPLTIMGINSFTRVENSIKAVSDNAVNNLAVELGKEILRSVNEGYRNILLLAQNPIVQSSASNHKTIQAELIKTHKFHRIFKDITLLDTKGQIITSARFSFRGTWKTTRWFKAALEGKTVFSNVHAVLYPYDIVMTVATPVRDLSENLIGVLVGQIEMERVWRITKAFSIGKDSEVIILDDNGIVISAYDSNLILEPIRPDNLRNTVRNEKKGITEFDQNDIRKVAVYVPIGEESTHSNLNWTAVIVMPESEMYLPIFHARNSLLFASIASFVIIILLSFSMSRPISRRIGKLVEATRLLGKGDFSRKVADLGNDEIGELGKAFNRTGKQLAHSRQLSEQAENELRKAHDNLEKRVRERTADLVRAKEAAEAASTAKSAFLANMSHELRTPLNHIIGFTEMVYDKHVGDINETQAEYLNDVLQSSNHLLSLINEVLDLAKVEAGRLELDMSDVNLKLLLENSLVMVKEKAMQHGIRMAPDLNGVPETVRADERKLKQILYNLLSNAVKFTPDGGEVRLAGRMVDCIVRSGRRLGDQENLKVIEPGIDGDVPGGARRKKCVEISISDTGIGMKPEDLGRVFNPFEQVEDSNSRRFQGTGLGLALAKQFVELHGGKIWAESEGEGKGSTFGFAIPI